MEKETTNRRDPKKYLTALQVAHDAYMEALENAILPCAEEVADLKEFAAKVREHRTYLIRESRTSAEAVRKRTNTPAPSYFAVDANLYTEEEYHDRAVKAEDLLKDVLDKWDSVDALRAAIYHYIFTTSENDVVTISRKKWEEMFKEVAQNNEKLSMIEEHLKRVLAIASTNKAKS